jgi:hypothetical protein
MVLVIWDGWLPSSSMAAVGSQGHGPMVTRCIAALRRPAPFGPEWGVVQYRAGTKVMPYAVGVREGGTRAEGWV